MPFGELKKLWSDFEDVPIDKDECIDENFHIWCKGTDRYEIWHWFDDRLPHGLACGIAGFTDDEISPLFAEAHGVENIVLPPNW